MVALVKMEQFKYFEKHNIIYTGSDSKSSSIAMDKNQTKLIAKNNIPV